MRHPLTAWLIALLLLLSVFPHSSFSQSLSSAVSQGQDPDEFLDHIGEDYEPPSSETSRAATNPNFNLGYLSHAPSSGDDAGRASAIQSDGKILVAGRTSQGTNSLFSISRYNPDGSLDTSFSSGGTAIHSFGILQNIAYALTLQTDGKVIATGKTDLGIMNQYNFGTLRLNTDGSLDTSFNTTGKITTNFSTGGEIARASSLQTDGKVLVAGYQRLSGGGTYAATIIRYNTNGSLDTSFNSGGQLTTAIVGSDNAILSLAIQTNGRVLGAGNAYNGTDWDIAIVRYNTDGSLDTSFFTKGSRTLAIGTSNDTAQSIALSTNGGILVGGGSSNGTNLDYSIVKLNSDGSLDTSFHTSGKLTTTIGTSDETITSLSLQTDAKIFAAGYSSNGTSLKIALLRYLTDGTLDTSFFTSGKLTSSIGTGEDAAQSISMLSNDYFVLAGRTYNGSNFDIAVLRYNTDGTRAGSGTLDKSFGTAGRVITLIDTGDAANGMVFQTDGRLIIAGTSTNQTFVLIRYNLDGTLDTSFNSSGEVATTLSTGGVTAQAVAIQTDGGIIVVGFVHGATNTDFAITRFNTNGSIDTSFNTVGYKFEDVFGNDSFGAVTIQTDGKILAGGGDNGGAIVRRYNTDGSLDTSTGNFAVGGSPLMITSEGKVVVGIINDTAHTLGIARLKSNLALDTSFNTTGVVDVTVNSGTSTTVKSVELLSNGSIGAIAAVNNQVTTVRFTSSGNIDTSFFTSGAVFTNCTSIGSCNAYQTFLQGNEKQVSFADGWGGASQNDFWVARYTTDGRLDTTFNTGETLTDMGANGVDHPYTSARRPNGKFCGAGVQNTGVSSFAIACYWP